LPLTVYKKDLPKWAQSNDLPDEFILPWASGLISSKKRFKLGWIEAEIMLPREEMQWSAFWTSGSETWPPEIDIFEAYTDQDVEDIKVQPNIHYMLDDKGAKTDYGAPTIAVRKPADRFVKYAVHWTEDFIKFYYDGLLVQVSTNHQALKDNAAEQYIILNNGLKWPTKLHHPTEGQMIVRNLKVFQKKNVTELDK
jgi:beta-glucanase (GH16 family)